MYWPVLVSCIGDFSSVLTGIDVSPGTINNIFFKFKSCYLYIYIIIIIIIVGTRFWNPNPKYKEILAQ